jgi:hypothetical protein
MTASEIARKARESAASGNKIAMFHYQVLINAEELRGGSIRLMQRNRSSRKLCNRVQEDAKSCQADESGTAEDFYVLNADTDPASRSGSGFGGDRTVVSSREMFSGRQGNWIPASAGMTKSGE